MRKQESEELVIEEIFGSKISLRELKFGDLIYLKDSLDERIRQHPMNKINRLSGVIDVMDPLWGRTAIKEGYNWREIIGESVVKGMYPEQALYLDCLARLNEIYEDICASPLYNIVK